MNESSSAPLRVLIADDHHLVRTGLKLILEQREAPPDIKEVQNRDEVMRSLKRQPFELLLTDLMMPGMVGPQSIREFLEIQPDCKILVVSMSEDAQLIYRLIEAGAAGFMHKSFSPETLQSAIDMILEGETYLPVEFLEAQLNQAKTGGALESRLTKRQRDVVREIAAGKSNKQIAYELNLSEATVKVHVASIMRALNLRNRTQVALYFQKETQAQADME